MKQIFCDQCGFEFTRTQFVGDTTLRSGCNCAEGRVYREPSGGNRKAVGGDAAADSPEFFQRLYEGD